MWKKKIIVFALLVLSIVTMSNHSIQQVNEEDGEGKINIELYSIAAEETNY